MECCAQDCLHHFSLFPVDSSEAAHTGFLFLSYSIKDISKAKSNLIII